MRFSVLRSYERNLARGAAVILIGGLAAGCSSGASRFSDGVDGVFTASTANQRQIMKPDQPFPTDSRVSAAPVDGTYTGSVNRDAVRPVNLSNNGVSRSTLAPAAPLERNASLPPVSSEPMPRQVTRPVATAAVDNTVTGTVAPRKNVPFEQVSEDEPKGWSRAGGTQVTVKDGETVYNLSKRFGVPADVIMKVNGLGGSSALQAGQKIIIPTYVYNNKAPVSAPDNNPNVADAKSSRGTKYDVAPGKVPVPSKAPTEKLAVLPKSPRVEGEVARPTEATSASNDVPTTKGGGAGTYKVQSGDTLSGIARKTGVGTGALKSANGLQDGLLRVGQTLKIPAGGKATQQVASAAATNVDPMVTGTTGSVARKNNAEAKNNKTADAKVAAYTPPTKTDKTIKQAEEETSTAAPDATGIGRMRWPVRGRVISNYGGAGGAKPNDGIDIAVPEGTPVKAAENGVVIYAGDGLKEFGNTVLVRHENGLVTVYGHAGSLEVKRGEKVKRGQEIARSGMSGTTDTPKLHFEVRKDSAPVDPSGFLE